MVGIGRRQVALEHAALMKPLSPVQPAGGSASTWTIVRLSRGFSASSSSRKVIESQILAAVKQDHRPLVASVGERADHAHHRRDADAAGDQHVHVGRIADGECAVRAIEVDALAAPAPYEYRS